MTGFFSEDMFQVSNMPQGIADEIMKEKAGVSVFSFVR